MVEAVALEVRNFGRKLKEGKPSLRPELYRNINSTLQCLFRLPDQSSKCEMAGGRQLCERMVGLEKKAAVFSQDVSIYETLSLSSLIDGLTKEK